MRRSFLKSTVFTTAIFLSACGGGGGSPAPSAVTPPVTGGPTTPPPALATKIESRAEASDFLSKMSFGGTQAQIDALIDKDAAPALKAQFNLAYDPYLPRVQSLYDSYGDNGRRNTAHRTTFWNDMITKRDQMRQRMVFALSQILVVSDKDMGNRPAMMASYMDVIGRNAFGNYRDLLEEVTYSPAMGFYLTYRGNRKGDARTGRTPDENYAREILQLFSIGLVELNLDGTPKLDSAGEPIESYTNEDILGLAKVFTGLDLERGADNQTAPDAYTSKLAIFEDRHSLEEKVFLGTTIPADTTTEASIDLALDAIFEHPNVAPFISRQLIQRFTASSPEPAYVRRVATVFESGTYTSSDGTVFGAGQRGDLEATMAAILLDDSQFPADDTIRTTTDLGKVREPVLNFVHWARAFNASEAKSELEWDLLYNAGDPSERIGQMPWNSSSVFNFYRPGFVASGTESADQNLTVPEFQLILQGARTGYSRMMTEYAFDNTSGPGNGNQEDLMNFRPDYSAQLEFIDNADEMANSLNDLLLGGRMSDLTRKAIVDGVPAIPIRTNTPENTSADEFKRVAYAVTIAVTSPEFMVR